MTIDELIKSLIMTKEKSGDMNVHVMKEYSCEAIKRVAPCEIKDGKETLYTMLIIE